MSTLDISCAPKYRLLTQEQVQAIHRASLQVLETIGVRIPHPEALGMLAGAGCRVGEGSMVQMPAGLVERCLGTAPTCVTVYNRLGAEAMRLEGRRNYFGMGTDLVNTIDLETGETRRSVLKDVANAARVADACPEIDFIASYALPHDVPTNTMYLECFKAEVENSAKPIFFTAAGVEDLELILEIASTVAGGEEALRARPFLIHYSEPTAPLSHSIGAVRKLFLCAERGVPICYTPGDLMGGTLPVTLAGAAVQATAEALSGIVLHQLRRPGSPIITGWLAVPMDMRSGVFSYGAPETRLTNSAFADVFHHYGLPMWSTVGSDSHALDGQAAMEHGIATLMAALDGANLIHDVGYMGQGLLGSPAALVMCDEIISYVKRLLRGFELTPETMALDVIGKVGSTGNYLTQRHTMEHFRQEQWRPKSLNRAAPEAWAKAGSLTLAERVTRRAREILGSHTPPPLPGEVQAKMDAIAVRARETLASIRFVA